MPSASAAAVGGAALIVTVPETCWVASAAAVAVIVTSAERARDLRQPPVNVLGYAQCAPGDNLRTDRHPGVETGAKRSAEIAFRMAQAGWDIPAPEASMFAWAPVPERFREARSMEFAKQLLINAKVAVSPGVGFGEYGEGYVRVALVENEQRIRQAARSVKKFLAQGTNNPPSDVASEKGLVHAK